MEGFLNQSPERPCPSREGHHWPTNARDRLRKIGYCMAVGSSLRNPSSVVTDKSLAASAGPGHCLKMPVLLQDH